MKAEREDSEGTVPSLRFGNLLILFLAALAVRIVYALTLYATMGVPGLMGEDSNGFISQATRFAAAISEGTVSGWDWLGPDESVMPLFIWILTGLYLLAGPDAPWLFVMLNGVADAGTALIVVGIAAGIRPRIALAAGWFYALIPTTVVIAGLVYTDTLFVFFSAMSLWLFLDWSRTRRTTAALGFGAALGCATMIRAVMAPWAAVVFLLAGSIALLTPGKRLGTIGQLFVAGLIALILVSPVLSRNSSKYDSLALTPQSGVHWLYWVVPFVEQTATGAARDATVARLRKTDEVRRIEAQANRFAISAGLAEIAFRELQRLGWRNIAKTWAVGMAINLGVPAVSVAPPARTLERPSYYATGGQGLFGKVETYLLAALETVYGWLLIAGFAGLLLFRLLQLAGVVSCFRAAKGATLFLMAWCLYLLLVSGPIASPKYRLPLEPVLAVFAGAGWRVLRRRKDDTLVLQVQAP